MKPNTKKKLKESLNFLLSLRRGHGSSGEALACKWLVAEGFKPIGDLPDETVAGYICGNLESRTVIMGHIDTVHWGDPNKAYQNFRHKDGLYMAMGKNCLGADDAAGVSAIMALREERPDLCYIIHRGEECGGRGATVISRLVDADIAISLDRKGFTDVITHQGWGRCCSDEFGNWLVGCLGFNYEISSRGIYTDSAEYVDVCAECTNLSVGYQNEHTSSERLFGAHLERLVTQLINIDFTQAPLVRDKSKRDSWYGDDSDYSRYHNYSKSSKVLDPRDYDWNDPADREEYYQNFFGGYELKVLPSSTAISDLADELEPDFDIDLISDANGTGTPEWSRRMSMDCDTEEEIPVEHGNKDSDVVWLESDNPHAIRELKNLLEWSNIDYATPMKSAKKIYFSLGDLREVLDFIREPK